MNIAAILEDAGIEIRRHGEHRHASEGWVATDCPLCSPDSRHYRMGFSETGGCSCWVCGRQSAPRMMAMLCGWPVAKCAELLHSADRPLRTRKATGKLVLPRDVGPMTKPHRRYLEGRGFCPDELERVWKVQGTGQLSSLPWRLFIPIHADREVVSWTTRELHDRGKRYHSAGSGQEKIHHKDVLYGEDLCSNSVIVHEGPTDVWRTGPGAVATLGLTVTSAQVYRLSRFMRRIICLDNSPDAQRRARKLANDLSCYDGETVLVRLDSPDPGSATVAEINSLRGLL